MKSGIVKWFNKEKGYGFITEDGTEKDFFVHYSGLAGSEGKFKSVEQNEKVTFDTEEGKKGLQAVNVMVVK